MSERWLVVGGGMLGLTVAWRAALAGRRVTVMEAAPELGGLASAWSLGDATWDRHYHVTLLSDSYVRQILREIGLESEMRWVETKTGFWDGKQLSSISNSIEYLQLPALSLVDKVRLGGTIWWGSRVTDWETLERMPVQAWLTKLSGARAFDRLWRPLLEAKLGDRWRESSAAFIWATIQRLYAARRSGLKKEMFGYVAGGYARFLGRFAEALAEQGVTLRTGCPVEAIEGGEPSEGDGDGDGGGVRVTAAGQTSTFDRVVVTTAPPVTAKFATGLADEERAKLAAIPYQGIVCASLLLRRPLAGYYLTYLTGARMPFTAVVEMTSMVDPAEVGGNHLVYLPLYVDAADPRFRRSDDEIRAEFWAGLRRLFPDLEDDDCLAFRVSRVPHVFPLPTLGYSETVPARDTSIPGLHLVNSAQIVNGTLNVNDSVRTAEEAAAVLLREPPRGGVASAPKPPVAEEAHR